MNQSKKIKSRVLLDFHHGMGDELICHGLVREYCKKYETVGIFCIKRNYPNVSFMYRDLSILRIHVVSSHTERLRFRFLNPLRFGQNRYDEIRAIDGYDEESGIRFERQASEIHVVDSSFIVLIDSLPYVNNDQKLYKHQYARATPAAQSPMLRKPWTILV